LDDISIALNVCRRTLIHWNRQLADDIADLREVEREALRRKLFGNTHDWMKGELDHYQRLDKELARREFKYSPTESVFRMRAESRKTIEKFLFAETELDRPRPKSPRLPIANPKSEIQSSAPSADSSQSQIANGESKIQSGDLPSAAPLRQSPIANPKSEIDRGLQEFLPGESIPIDPNESTRDSSPNTESSSPRTHRNSEKLNACDTTRFGSVAQKI
ncbi:MAG: hypothetical protein L0219_08280, partial [Phycisphaerales bacterium]|nr:hypothetical protein [Phycisphaerales bacterium]